jgi:inorganic pyrophosphatase
MNDEKFWRSLDELVASCHLVIDRPAGSAHPTYPQLIYPYDYGYLEGTQSMDQGGIDVWLGRDVHHRVTGVICTVDLHRRDAEIKILLACSREEAAEILKIHNDRLQSGLLIWRDIPASS